MKTLFVALVVALLVGLGGLLGWRVLDRQADARAWRALRAHVETDPGTFDPAMVAELPEPARRYFNYTITSGARIRTVVELDMVGEIGSGTKHAHSYQPMTARQILAPPYGLLWQVKAATLSGSDAALPGKSWTRFWLFGVLPIVRAGDADHQRSAFGRVVAEAAFWVPASLLPGSNVRWEAAGADSARAIVGNGSFEQAVDITVNDEGAPVSVLIQRWSNVNSDSEYREQPFGGELSDFRRFGGYRLPARVEGGNHFGTDEYYPFFKAEIADIRFPDTVTPP